MRGLPGQSIGLKEFIALRSLTDIYAKSRGPICDKGYHSRSHTVTFSSSWTPGHKLFGLMSRCPRGRKGDGVASAVVSFVTDGTTRLGDRSANGSQQPSSIDGGQLSLDISQSCRLPPLVIAQALTTKR
jgi:hypothetical protein